MEQTLTVDRGGGPKARNLTQHILPRIALMETIRPMGMRLRFLARSRDVGVDNNFVIGPL